MIEKVLKRNEEQVETYILYTPIREYCITTKLGVTLMARTVTKTVHEYQVLIAALLRYTISQNLLRYPSLGVFVRLQFRRFVYSVGKRRLRTWQLQDVGENLTNQQRVENISVKCASVNLQRGKRSDSKSRGKYSVCRKTVLTSLLLDIKLFG